MKLQISLVVVLDTKPGTDLDSLNALHQEALFLSESSVDHLEPIGEGTIFVT